MSSHGYVRLVVAKPVVFDRVVSQSFLFLNHNYLHATGEKVILDQLSELAASH
jgi:hypothetical protein